MSAPNITDRVAVAESVAAAASGAQPDEDARFRATIDEGEAAFVRGLADEAAAHLEGKSAGAILSWAAGVVPRFAVTSSFGTESAVLLHLLNQVAPSVPAIFLETGYHFGETLAYRDRLAAELDLRVIDALPELSVAEQNQAYGAALYARDPESCCAMRKTEPLRRALADFDGWATGVRRDQTSERARTPVVEARRHDGRWLVKVAPLAGWSDADIEGYLEAHQLPRHPLADQGYASIGCAPCTQPVAAGQDPRAGRWAGFDKTECGIHLPDDSARTREATTPG